MSETPSVSTRERIQQVALELFAEQGYDKTSLREIAERLEVTKAALYYHFKSKEEILRSVLEDYLTEIEGLVEWADGLPRNPETKREIIVRYTDIVERGFKAMRFIQQNPGGLQDPVSAERFRAAMKKVNELFRDRDAPLVEQVRALAAVVAIHIGTIAFGSGHSPLADEAEEVQHDPAEVNAAIVQVASELVTGDRTRRSATGARSKRSATRR